MARTFDLCCEDCRVYLWIGQRPSAGEFYLYTAERHLDLLCAFFVAHVGHQLRLVDTENRDDDMRSLEPDDDDR